MNQWELEEQKERYKPLVLKKERKKDRKSEKEWEKRGKR